MPAALLLALSVLLAAPEAGIWLPTSGRAGERALQGMATGGDGALYAAGGGVVYRLEPGAEWMRLGRYAPRLSWDPSGHVDARGSFPTWLLQRVEADAAAEVDIPESGPDGEPPPEVVRDELRAFMEEQETVEDSPYHVASVAAASHGVWIATGAGLFRATRDGVSGPRPDVRGPVNAVLGRKDETLVGTRRGLWRIPPDAPAVQIRAGAVSALTEAEGALVFVEDGFLWAGPTAEAASRLDTPAPNILAIAGDGGGLYLATRFAVYRRQAAKWGLCAAVPTPPTLLVAGEGILHGVSADAIYLFSESCAQVTSAATPWPGGFEFTDVARAGGLVWAASNEGAFLLTPLDADTSLSVQMEGYQRAIASIPTLDVLVMRALDNLELSPAHRDIGSRPLWAPLLPEVTATVAWLPARKEVHELAGDGNQWEIEVSKPKPSWTLMAYWTIDFGRMPAFVPVEQAALMEDASAGAVGPAGEAEQVEEVPDYATTDIIYDDEATALMDALPDTQADLEDAAARQVAQDRRQLANERHKLVVVVQRLYQQRQALLYRLWVLRSKDLQQRTTLLLSVDEIDARLSALTGLAFRSTGYLTERDTTK